jgi:hypothetical protein
LIRQTLYLTDEKGSFVKELLVFGPVFEELRQEIQQPVFIRDEDLQHCWAFVGVGDEDFEDVEAFILYHSSVIAEKLHTELQVLAFSNIGCHDGIVGPIKEDLTEELDGLSFGYVRVRVEEEAVVEAEEAVKVGC